MALNFHVQKARIRGKTRKVAFVILFLVYIGFVSVSLVLKQDNARQGFRNSLTFSVDHEDHKRVRREANSSGGGLGEDEPELKNCTPRAIKEFPDNFFTFDETQKGGMAVHILIALYMFGGLAIVCDDYFVASLEFICDRLNLQEDVAGATFMAAGSSAPEFFTSVIGVFIAKSDVGVGTIVGSAVFNILFIIGVCAIFAGMIVKLTWYPMTRDCISYLVSIAALVIIIEDEHVYWHEALILVLLYAFYILLMYFNRSLEKKAIDFVACLKKRLRHSDTMSVRDVAEEEKQPLSDNSPSTAYTNSMEKVESVGTEEGSIKETTLTENSSQSNGLEDNYGSPWDWPDHWLLRVYWVTMVPLKALLFISIPDCRRRGIFRKLYLLTFTASILWIAGFSYIMVWMVTIVGDALDIPDTVMGLTILAAGTSVPDCLSSIFVARDGYGDMAVSNSIGSNVFDILMCLGLPWLLDTTINKKGDALIIYSEGISYSAIILLSTVAFMLVAINLAKWKLQKPFGCMCLIAYCAVITVSCLFELNVFGDYVLPSCARDSET